MPRFTDGEIQNLNLDRDSASRATCPFCGGELLSGWVLHGENYRLVHSAEPPPGQLVVREVIPGCEPFRTLPPLAFLGAARSAGLRWEKLIP